MDPWKFLSLIGGFFDYFQNERANAEARDLRADTTEGVRGAQEGVTEAASIPFNFQSDGQALHFAGADAPGFNLDNYFNVGSSQLENFRANRPNVNVDLSLPTWNDEANWAGIDNIIGGTRGRLDELFQGAKLKPGALREGVDLPDADLSDVLNADLAGIGAASRGNVGQRRAEIAAHADQFGGLENADRFIRAADMDEAAARGTASASAVGDVRNRETAIKQFNANTIANLNKGEADINSVLAQAMMGQEGNMLSQRLGLIPQLLSEERMRAALKADVDTGNVGRETDLFNREVSLVGGAAQDDLTQFLTALDLMMKQGGFDQNAASTILSSELGLGQINAPSTQTNWLPIYQMVMGMVEGDGPKETSGGGATILGTGGSWSSGCVAGFTKLWTPNGMTTLRRVKPGDLVLAADGRFRRVLLKEFGRVAPKEREGHVLVRTDRGGLVMTRLHPILGRPAEGYRRGDMIPWVNVRDGGRSAARVHSVTSFPYVVSGDLRLEGSNGYVAGGMIVDSVIAPAMRVAA